MSAPSSAPQPHQVSRTTWRFAGPTSGTVARSHGSLDRRRARLAVVCRLRNYVIVVLRELLKIITELHEYGRLVTAAAQIKFLCYWHAVRSADSATGHYYKGLPVHDDRVLTALAHMFAGCGSCSEYFVGTTVFVSGCSPFMYWTPLCSGAAQIQ